MYSSIMMYHAIMYSIYQMCKMSCDILLPCNAICCHAMRSDETSCDVMCTTVKQCESDGTVAAIEGSNRSGAGKREI